MSVTARSISVSSETCPAMRRSASKRSTKVASLRRGRALRAARLEQLLASGSRTSAPRVPADAARVQPDQRDRVERQPAERRRQHRVQREPVQRVRERREPVAQVGHLLLAPVAAAAHHVHGYPALVERALEEAHRRRGAEQDHDVAVGPRALARELVDPLGEQARLRGAPRAARRASDSPKRSPPLGRAPSRRRGRGRPRAARRTARPRAAGSREPGASRSGSKRLAPGALEGEVDRVEDLAAGAEVDGDALGAAGRARLLPVLAEDAHVGVPEAVDRLVLVADPEQVVAREQREQLVLEPVRVLELVHQHVLEARRVRLAEALVAGQQVARHELEVLEVERRALALAALVALAVELEQHAQHRVVAVLALGDLERPRAPRARRGTRRRRPCRAPSRSRP